MFEYRLPDRIAEITHLRMGNKSAVSIPTYAAAGVIAAQFLP
jgi:hypothetical protein